MKLYEIDPVRDRRWAELVDRHDGGSIFHSPEWLEALRRTYQYEPVAFTDSAPGEALNNGLLFCRVQSWLTGDRLVSLPFSDHCEPLVQSTATLSSMLESISQLIGREGRYIEIRPRQHLPVVDGFVASATYCLHSIDLRADVSVLFNRLHRSHMRRRVRKAQRHSLRVEVGRSASLLSSFYDLHVLTRRRQGIPVQPMSWFENLVDCLGDRLTVELVRHQGRPAAAIITAVQKQTLVYKYGCSDFAFSRYGGTPLVFWHAIQRAKEQGLHEFDLGRSDIDNKGLLAFKDRLGAKRNPLTYYRYTSARSTVAGDAWAPTLARHAYSVVPRRIQASIGRALYRHFG